MHALRTSSMLTRLVLAWFVTMLGVAGASPIVHPRPMEIVCTAGGMKIVVIGDDGASAQMGRHALDCSLCLSATPPPLPARVAPATPRPLAHVPKPVVAAYIAVLAGAPLPPRGPPFFA